MDHDMIQFQKIKYVFAFCLIPLFIDCKVNKFLLLQSSLKVKKNIVIVYTAPPTLKNSRNRNDLLNVPDSFHTIKYSIKDALDVHLKNKNIIVSSDHFTIHGRIPLTVTEFDKTRIPPDSIILVVNLLGFYEAISVGIKRKQYNVLLEVNLRFLNADTDEQLSRNKSVGSVRLPPVENKSEIDLLSKLDQLKNIANQNTIKILKEVLKI